MNTVQSMPSSLPALQTGPHPVQHQHLRSLSSTPTPALGAKKRSFLSKTFRGFSSQTSLDNAAALDLPDRSSTPSRRVLQKTTTNASIINRLNRRVSKGSTTSSTLSEDTSGSPVPRPFFAPMKVLKHGPLKSDGRVFKARTEYAVLTDEYLIKFSSAEMAKATMAELGAPSNRISRASTWSGASQETSAVEGRLEIPLRRIINIFNEEGSSPYFGLDVWWSEAPPQVSWSNAKLFFGMPKERDDWMADILRALRELVGRTAVPHGIIAENVEAKIYNLVAAEEPACVGCPLDIFPVVQRTMPVSVKPDNADASKKVRDGSSYYLLLGQNMLYLVRVARTSIHTPTYELDTTMVVFGLTSLVRLKATMVPHEERFVLGFRMPCEAEKRLELASRWYREIVMTLMKADRSVKPAWPQHLQRDIFEIRGLTERLHLPSGQDFGGLKRTLEAYCATYRCLQPDWTVNWKCERREHSPEFRLLPSKNPGGYTSLQLLAILRALRFNDYFKSLSFRDVDFGNLCGWSDHAAYDESIADVSRDGLVIDQVHREIIRTSPILLQEIHAVAFTSGSIRRIDLTNVLASQKNTMANTHSRGIRPRTPRKEAEVVQPILLLLRTQNSPCDTLLVGGNPLSIAEVDELVTVLGIPNTFKHLDISRCNLDDESIREIWDALPGQGSCLEILDTSRNPGHIDHVVVENNLAHLPYLRKLNMAGNCRGQLLEPLFSVDTMFAWRLEELNLSDIKMSDSTMDVLAAYMATAQAANLRRLDLNNCGITGFQLARLFRECGQGRDMICSVNGNYLEAGTDDLATAISYGYGPVALFMDMIEYRQEFNYDKIMRAFALNKTIKLLSLVGTATPGQASEEACLTVTEFFAKNTGIRCLDLSGFCAKLDEGQLGLGFSRSLAGLAQNITMHHLRIRNQKLNINIGDLATAIAQNKTLHTLDVQDNDFNLSNLSHMVKSLEQNNSILDFCPFSPLEIDKGVNTSVQKATTPASQPEKRSRRYSSLRGSKSNVPTMTEANKLLVQELRSEWTAKVGQIEVILERNRKLAAEAETHRQQWGMPVHFIDDSVVGSLSSLFGGLAASRGETKLTAAEADIRDMVPPIVTPPSATDSFKTLHKLQTAPHHVSRDEVLESPTTEGVSTSSGVSTPPEWTSIESPVEEMPGPSYTRGAHGDPKTPDGETDYDSSLVHHMMRHGMWDGKEVDGHDGVDVGNEADKESV